MNSLDVAVGDLDGDGDLDALVASKSSKVWLNDGAGLFSDSGQTLPESFSLGVALGDLDGDGDLDAFAANVGTYDPENTVLLNESAVRFTKAQCLGNSQSAGVALGDLDGDGDLDAFVANMETPGHRRANRVWLNGRGIEPLACVCTLEWIERSEWPSRVVPASALRAYNALKRAADDQDLFYRLRDELLDKTPNGSQCAHLYYTHDREIPGLLVVHSALRDEGRAALELWKPPLQALLDGQGDAATITAGQVQAMDDFLTNLSAMGSLDLQQDIAAARAGLGDLDDFVGMTMEESRELVIGYVAYLPIVQKP